MARKITCGFELQSVAAGFEVAASTGSPTISTGTVRSGLASLNIPSLASATPKGVRWQFAAAAADGGFHPRAYYDFVTFPVTGSTVMQLNDTADFANPIVWVTVDQNKTFTLFDEDGQIGSSSSPLVTGTWYRLELYFDRNEAAGSHNVFAFLDGVQFAGSTSRDLSAGVLGYSVGGNLNSEVNAVGAWFIDDVAFNDENGSNETSDPGEGEIIRLNPNAAGDNADWTRGGVDSGANWSQVTEVVPNDLTDYVQANTLDQIDDYNITNTPSSMEATDVIKVVQVGVRWRVDDNTGTDPSFVVRAKSEPGGTVEEGSALTANNATWRCNSATLPPITYTLVMYDLPGADANPWTKAKLDTAQIGIRESVSDTHNIQVTDLWMMVEHKPAAAVQATRKFQRSAVVGV